ncbi:YeiH family protein [Desulfoluna spongiiphila]|uniref:Conserved hypothetical integral membrane protein n=1 Tax=Desulfoluna spongiiphila TaxID=419481 RepID=A0A1G5IKJ1_9BACT|nr:YeiH family protein [Desulfoluna spongiiphila]SCY75948.1 conserved hypothetical integral membrane protein [Desulfoluna spongiiphila]VVS90920.1 uncharacterised protein family upf0324 bacteria [Desulfoluna spongiiphila]
MFFPAENRKDAMNGLLFVTLFATTAIYCSEFPPIKRMGVSPLIIGIMLGMIYGNTLRMALPARWVPGIVFATRTLLKLGVILYGFRITFQDIAAVGTAGFAVSVTMATSTFLLGSFLGIKFFKLDYETAMLTSIGSSICGAAAVLATEPVLKSDAHKSAMAVSTVVLFGTLTMFLYPALYKAGFFDISEKLFGIYIGGTIHEVAHAVAAGNAISPEAASSAIIVKMLRVMLIAPFLIGISIWLGRRKGAEEGKRGKITIPWFAVLFIIVAGINSMNVIPTPVVAFWNRLDLFILTMAMCALGIETNFNRIRGVGMKPVWLALILFGWLTIGGYGVTRLMSALFA